MDELLYSGLYRITITPISVKVKDQDEIKAEKEFKKTNPLFNNSYYEALSVFSKTVSDALSFNFPRSSLNKEPRGKYRGFVSGGEASFRINSIGLIIKHVLKDYYN